MIRRTIHRQTAKVRLLYVLPLGILHEIFNNITAFQLKLQINTFNCTRFNQIYIVASQRGHVVEGCYTLDRCPHPKMAAAALTTAPRMPHRAPSCRCLSQLVTAGLKSHSTRLARTEGEHGALEHHSLEDSLDHPVKGTLFVCYLRKYTYLCFFFL